MGHLWPLLLFCEGSQGAGTTEGGLCSPFQRRDGVAAAVGPAGWKQGPGPGLGGGRAEGAGGRPCDRQHLCASVDMASGGQLRGGLQFSVGSGHCRDVGAKPAVSPWAPGEGESEAGDTAQVQGAPPGPGVCGCSPPSVSRHKDTDQIPAWTCSEIRGQARSWSLSTDSLRSLVWPCVQGPVLERGLVGLEESSQRASWKRWRQRLVFRRPGNR